MRNLHYEVNEKDTHRKQNACWNNELNNCVSLVFNNWQRFFQQYELFINFVNYLIFIKLRNL